MSLVLSGSTSGSVTLQEPAVAGTTVIDLPATSGTMVVTGGAQTVQFAAGSASTPSITFTGDTNTGIFSPAADTIAFAEGGAEAMRITSAGDVGIGTNNPQYPLTLVNSTANKEILFVKGSNTNTGTGLAGEGPIAIQNTNNTVGNMAAISNFDSNGNINVQINFINTDQAAGGAVGFTTRTNGGASYGERMRVTENGGTRFQCQSFAAQPSSTNAGVEINNTNSGSRFFGFGTGTETQIEFGNTNGTRGSIQTTSGGTSYNTTSDYRLKENVASMTGALAKVQQLKPCTYKWKLDGSDGQGFIAHELQEVIPDCVTGEKDGTEDIGTITDANGGIVSTNVKEPHSIGEGLTWTKTGSEIKYQMVDTSFLVATLTAAIQELKATVDAQAARIAALEGVK
jgi:hypothetical protein